MTNREQQEKLFRAIGFVGDDLIQRADVPVERKTVNTTWVKWAALAACCVLVIGLASRLPLLGGKNGKLRARDGEHDAGQYNRHHGSEVRSAADDRRNSRRRGSCRSRGGPRRRACRRKPGVRRRRV
ncbi:MAG: hypothetical protein V8T00_07370 [Oscillospiraceae bacterium]